MLSVFCFAESEFLTANLENNWFGLAILKPNQKNLKPIVKVLQPWLAKAKLFRIFKLLA